MSGTTNQELIESERVKKALIATDALASAGKLNPDQTDKFIDYIVDQSMLKNNARVVRFRAEQLEIHKLGLAKRVAMPASEARDPANRRGITTSKIVLQPREIIVPFEISDSVLEINLEGPALETHIIQMMAKQVANDLEDLYINGDLLGAAILEGDYIEGGSAVQYVKDAYMALFDGWLRGSDTGHIYDAAGANVGSTVFSRMLNQMPTKFRRNRADLRFYISPDLEQLYREKVSTRATGAGDTALQTESILTPFGVPMVVAPLFPFQPKIVEHKTLGAAPPAVPVALRYKPIVSGSEVVTLQTLAGTPTTKYILNTDYEVDYANGTINAKAGGALAAGANVKVTYSAQPQLMLTHPNNFIVAIGRDIRMERDRDIYKRVNQYVITMKVDVKFEETDALVKGVNVGTGV